MAAEAPKVGAHLFFEPELAALVPGQSASTLKGAAIDVLLSLGGDGTLLRGARLACERGIPVLGVNLGHVGFLAAGDQSTATELLRRVVRGEYTIESRLALTAHIGDSRQEFLAVNDVVIHKGGIARVIRLAVAVDGVEVGTYSADGLIVAALDPVPRPEELLVSIDGQVAAKLTPQQAVTVVRAAQPVLLARVDTESFFARLRQKLQWGDLSDRQG
jgi:NAD+ kinase